MANTELDEGFVAEQRERLLQLRDELVRIQRGMEGDQKNRSEEEGDFSQHDSGDMSQQMFTREMDATIGEQAGRRLEDVERALEKIDEGTYGLSDESGEPIAKGRLEAAPEAYAPWTNSRVTSGSGARRSSGPPRGGIIWPWTATITANTAMGARSPSCAATWSRVGRRRLTGPRGKKAGSGPS